MSSVVALGALAVIGVGLALCVIRAWRGPSLFDRVMALDLIALHFVAAVLLDSLVQKTGAYMDVVLVVVLLGFIGTMALAAYLEGSLVD